MEQVAYAAVIWFGGPYDFRRDVYDQDTKNVSLFFMNIMKFINKQKKTKSNVKNNLSSCYDRFLSS